MRAPLMIALVLFGTSAAFAAEEPSGCDKFKWNIDRERAALTAPDRIKLASGGDLAALPTTGMLISLRAPGEAQLPSPPERAPKDGTFAGFANIKARRRPACTPSACPPAAGSIWYRMGIFSSRRLLAAPPTATASARP